MGSRLKPTDSGKDINRLDKDIIRSDREIVRTGKSNRDFKGPGNQRTEAEGPSWRDGLCESGERFLSGIKFPPKRFGVRDWMDGNGREIAKKSERKASFTTGICPDQSASAEAGQQKQMSRL